MQALITNEDIRGNLKNIRFYYSYIKDFKNDWAKFDNNLINTVNLYNSIIRKAPIRLYHMYYELYIENHTQHSLANKLCYCEGYIQQLNRKLILFLYENLNQTVDI